MPWAKPPISALLFYDSAMESLMPSLFLSICSQRGNERLQRELLIGQNCQLIGFCFQACQSTQPLATHHHNKDPERASFSDWFLYQCFRAGSEALRRTRAAILQSTTPFPVFTGISANTWAFINSSNKSRSLCTASVLICWCPQDTRPSFATPRLTPSSPHVGSYQSLSSMHTVLVHCCTWQLLVSYHCISVMALPGCSPWVSV